MDELDLKVLFAFFGSRTWHYAGIDPRLSVRDLADRVDAAPSTVWARLKEWEETGLLRGYGVLPHPGLFASKFVAYNLRVEDPAKKADVLQAGRAADGLVMTVEHAREWVSLTTYDPSEAAMRRRRDLFGALPHVAECEEPHVMTGFPRLDRDPAAVELRILEGFLRSDDASVDAVADRVGLTPKTVRKWYERMLDDHLLWVQPNLDLSVIDGVVANLMVGYAADADPDAVDRAVREVVPDVLRFGVKREGAGGEDLRIWQGLKPFRNLGEIDDALARLAKIEGAEWVDASYPLRIEVVTDWVADRVRVEKERVEGRRS